MSRGVLAGLCAAAIAACRLVVGARWLAGGLAGAVDATAASRVARGACACCWPDCMLAGGAHALARAARRIRRRRTRARRRRIVVTCPRASAPSCASMPRSRSSRPGTRRAAATRAPRLAGRARRAARRGALALARAARAARRDAQLHGLDLERIAFRDRVHLAGRVLPATLNARCALAHASIDSCARANRGAHRRTRRGSGRGGADHRARGRAHRIRLSLDQWRVFNATGTTHLVAISGPARDAVRDARVLASRAACGAACLRARRVERETFAWLLGLRGRGGYALLAGFSVPAQRTWLMLAVFALARLRRVSTARPASGRWRSSPCCCSIPWRRSPPASGCRSWRWA